MKKNGQTYQDLRTEGPNQFLLDAQGHMVQLHHSPEAVTLVRSSQAQGAPVGGTQQQRLDCQPESVRVGQASQGELPTLSPAHLAYLTGTHRDAQGSCLCLHDQRLYAFDAQARTWALDPATQDLKFSALLTSGNGKVYGQTEHALLDLSSPGQSRVALPAQVQSCAVAQTQLAVLSGDEAQHLQLFDLAQPTSPARSVALQLDNGSAQAKSIALSQKYL
ncbi:AvrE-family type 3 secretion system effector, partial [Mesorhizobium japonicum]|uniref:AvrE-family type 3 secretion system effector n=1 Tax=Mesorhizobium japonicum TaxID=2066070 RepID=UPI003B59D066